MPLQDGFKERGLCRLLADKKMISPELWWPNGTTGTEAEKIDRAKAICAACPVVTECLTYAIDYRQFFGIWGGTTEEERREARRQQRRMVDTERAVQVA